jgi:glycerate kinase
MDAVSRVLVAPDSFKGTFSAAQVAAALARGIEATGSAADVCPLGDGGEGTTAALLGVLGGEERHVAVTGPLGSTIGASFALFADSRAALDAAAASGLSLVDPSPRTAVEATTFGTGELILAALEAGATELMVGVGGTASTDGGAGAVAATAGSAAIGKTRLVCLCDVATPWELAASTFAPQKGADAAAVSELEERLDQLAGSLPKDPRAVAMAGAGGGLAGGLWAGLGAELVAGAAYVCDVVDIDGRLAGADLVITGEGALDKTSLEGKLVGEVARRAHRAGVPCHAIVGQAAPDVDPASLGLTSVIIASTLAELESAARGLP